jgi:hypothetical protein
MTQTPDKNPAPDEKSTPGADGQIFCLDLSSGAGQKAADDLMRIMPDVAATVRDRRNNHVHLLVMVPTSEQRAVLTQITDLAGLPEVIKTINARSKDYGESFSVTIVPPSLRIASMFGEMIETSGTA